MSSTAAYKIVPVYICFVHFFPRGGTWVFFGLVCAAQDSKLVPRSKKNVL